MICNLFELLEVGLTDLSKNSYIHFNIRTELKSTLSLLILAYFTHSCNFG